MDSGLLVKIHSTSAMLFLLTYVIKTILLFSNKATLQKYSAATKVPEMILSFVFFATGIWLYSIIGGIKKFHIIKLALVLLSIPLAVVAFKKLKKGLALIALLFIIGAYGLAEMSRAKPFIPTASAGSGETNGKMVYESNCVFCHGSAGNKMYRGAPDLTRSAFDIAAIKQLVREGSKGKMPAYSIIISDQNIEAVAEYVKSMQTGTQQ